MAQPPSLDVPAERYAQISREIASSDSPVGIDAQKTHILILHKLEALERRLARIERHLGLPGEEVWGACPGSDPGRGGA